MAAERRALHAAAVPVTVTTALLLSFAGAYALQAAVRSSAPLTAFLSLGVLALAAALFFAAGRGVRTRVRVWFAPAGILIGAASAALLIPASALASAHARHLASSARAKATALNHGLGLAQPTLRDGWGGEFHVGPTADGALRVWSDGPDAVNDGGSPRVDLRALIEFERPFDQRYSEPINALRSAVRSVALAESVSVWRRFRGDLVWRHSDARGLEAAGGDDRPRRIGAGDGQ